jgi:hypothetical protein
VFYLSLSNKFLVIRIFAFFWRLFEPAQTAALWSAFINGLARRGAFAARESRGDANLLFCNMFNPAGGYAFRERGRLCDALTREGVASSAALRRGDWARLMRALPDAINRKLGIICFDSRVFGDIDALVNGFGASAPSNRWPALSGAARPEPELRHGTETRDATRVLLTGTGA